MYNSRWEMLGIFTKHKINTGAETKKLSFKHIRFLLGWSERKTRRILNKLIKDGLVKVQDGCEKCGNEDKIYYPTPVKDFFSEDD